MRQHPHTIDQVLDGSARFTVVEGDCLDTLRGVPDACVDTVITDPPYGIDYKPDTAKPIANDERPFVWWLHDAARILKPGGGLVCFCRWDVQEDFKRCIELAGLKVCSQLVWDHVTRGGMGDTRQQFIPTHEVMWWAVKGRAFAFPNGRPASLLAHRIAPASMRQHPTQKPIDLMRDLVRSTTPVGGVVLDPCAGVGSTIEAAVRDGFRGIAIELDPGYCATARSRIAAAIKSSHGNNNNKLKGKPASPVHCVAARGPLVLI